MNHKRALTWLGRLVVLFFAAMFVIGKKARWMLVNIQKLGDEVVADPPWYYVKFHCHDMYTGAVEYTGGPFCIGMDLRVMILLPLGLMALGAALWLWYDKLNRQ